MPAETPLEQVHAERDAAVALAAKLASLLGYRVGRAVTDVPGWDAERRNCCYIDLPEVGQISFHYHSSEVPLFAGLPEYTGTWDGHDAETKYQRLYAFVGGEPEKRDGR
jgi:hypothetical protein